MCIFALKEILDLYNRHSCTVFMGFTDASKAFDRVNHEKLFYKLQYSGVPKSLIRILSFWYSHQSMYVKWGNCVSVLFKVFNGVRQGSILSSLLFNVFMDDPSKRLSDYGKGCVVDGTIINHLMYVDDLVIFCPYSTGLQQLLRVCSQYGSEFDITYNAKKSNLLIVKRNEDRKPGISWLLCIRCCSYRMYSGYVLGTLHI